MKSVLIIGMGKLGYHLAINMQELGNDVVIVDSNAEIIEKLSGKFTDAVIGDCTNEEVLESIGAKDFDICFVTIGENFQASLEVTSLLKEQGAKKVISKAHSKIQAKFLLRNGADEVIYPEYNIAQSMAVRFSMDNVFDCIELNNEYAIFEITVPKTWISNTIASLNVRNKHKVNVLAIKKDGKLNPMPGPDYTFLENDHIMVLGKQKDVSKLTD